MLPKAMVSSATTTKVALGDTLGRPSSSTVATMPAVWSVISFFISAVSMRTSRNRLHRRDVDECLVIAGAALDIRPEVGGNERVHGPSGLARAQPRALRAVEPRAGRTASVTTTFSATLP